MFWCLSPCPALGRPAARLRVLPSLPRRALLLPRVERDQVQFRGQGRFYLISEWRGAPLGLRHRVSCAEGGRGPGLAQSRCSEHLGLKGISARGPPGGVELIPCWVRGLCTRPLQTGESRLSTKEVVGPHLLGSVLRFQGAPWALW